MREPEPLLPPGALEPPLLFRLLDRVGHLERLVELLEEMLEE